MVASHEGKRLNLALLYSCATDNGIFRMLATKCDAILHRVPHTVRVHSPMTLLYMLAPSWGGNLRGRSRTRESRIRKWASSCVFQSQTTVR